VVSFVDSGEGDGWKLVHRQNMAERRFENIDVYCERKVEMRGWSIGRR
jgi:hypothetical protein